MIVLTLSFLFNDELACRLCVLRIIRENDLLDVVVEGEASTNAFEGYGVLTTGPGWRTADGHGFVFSIVGSSVLNCGNVGWLSIENIWAASWRGYGRWIGLGELQYGAG